MSFATRTPFLLSLPPLAEQQRPLLILKLPEMAHRFGSSDRAITRSRVDLTSGERVIYYTQLDEVSYGCGTKDRPD
jgi:hypothetical protein